MKKLLITCTLASILLMGSGCVVLKKIGVNDWLNKGDKTPDPTLPEMVIPKNLDPATNNVVPFF